MAKKVDINKRNQLLLVKLICISIGLSSLVLLQNCNTGSASELDPEYYRSMEHWKADRMEDVTSNWISLAGLEWLEEGNNPFGSDSSNQIVFPENSPSIIGVFELNGDSVIMKIEGDQKITVENNPITGNTIPIKNNDVYKLGSVEWSIIERAGNYGVRIWDRSRQVPKDFNIDYFNASGNWILRAKYTSYPEGKTYAISNVVGFVTETPIPGKLVFNKNNIEYSLDVMDGGEDSWFVIFGDKTNGEETYGSGRYIYVPKVENNNYTLIDFNRAYNPPCAFTEFATCPLPPPQNRLDLSVIAGEKYVHAD